MTLTLMQLNRLIGLNKSGDLYNPKVMDLKDFHYPRESLIIWLNGKATLTEPILQNSKSLQAYIVKYLSKEAIGKPVEAPISYNKIIESHKAVDDTILYHHRADDLLKVPSTKDILLDYSELNTLYRYKDKREREYAELKNPLLTAIEDIIENRYITRVEYLPVEIPNIIPKYDDILKMLKYDNHRIFKYLEDKSFYPHLEIIKYFFKEYRENSIFNLFEDIRLTSLNILLYKGLGVSLIQPQRLFSLSKDIEFSYNGLNKIPPKELLKRYLLFLINIANRKPIPKIELEKGKVPEDDIVKDSDDIDSSIESHNESNRVLEEDNSEDIESITVQKENNPIETAKDTITLLKGRDILTPKVIESNLFEVEETLKEIDKIAPKEEELKIESETLPVESVIDKSQAEYKIEKIDKYYIENIMDRHIKSSVLYLAQTGLPIKNYEEELVDNLSNRERIIKFEMKQITGNSKSIKIRLPIPDRDGIIRSNGNDYKLVKQRIDLPIKKTRPTEVVLSSAYGKLFIRKAASANSDLSRYLQKIFYKRSSDPNSPFNLYVSGSNILLDKKISNIYLTIGRESRSFLYRDIYFLFHYQDRETLLNGKDSLETIEKLGTLVGSSKRFYYVIDLEDNLYKVDNRGKKIEELGNFLEFLEIYNPIYEYAVIKVLGDSIPLAIPLLYYRGMSSLLRDLKIPYRFRDSKKDLKDSEFALRFIDGYLILPKDNYNATIIIGSLKMYEKIIKDYSFRLLDNRDTIKDILMAKGIDIRVIYELDSLRAIFLDPMTVDILKEMSEPTNFISLLIRAGELLKEDYLKDPRNIETFAIRGYDRLVAMMYHELAKAVRDHFHKAGRVRTTISVDEYSVKRALTSDATFTLLEDINPIESLKQGEESTLLGMFGRSKDTITNKDREYHSSMVGILSEATKDNINVGVTTYLSANPNLYNIYGMSKEVDDPTLTSIYSTSGLLAPGSLKDDGKRLLYISIQNKHLVTSKGLEVIPYRTGEESVIPYRVNRKFALHAKKDGKVIDVTKSRVTIQYKDKSKEVYKLTDWIGKDTGGKTYRHIMKTNLRKGDSIVAGDNIYYDSLYFGEDIFNRKRVCLKTGILSRVCQTESEDTFEDASIITKDLAALMETDIVYTKDKIFTTDVILEEIKRIGESVVHRDNLLSYRSTDDYNQELSKSGKELLKDISLDKLKAEVKGRVVDIDLYYNIPEESDIEISKSIKSLIEEFDKIMKSKYGKSGSVDSTFSIRGSGLKPGSIYIKYYIEKSLPMLSGDKYRVGNQLKSTVSEVYDKIETEDGESIGLLFSKRGIDARIIASVYQTGAITLILEKIQEQFIKDLG